VSFLPVNTFSDSLTMLVHGSSRWRANDFGSGPFTVTGIPWGGNLAEFGSTCIHQK
jgi:hypothetical protein